MEAGDAGKRKNTPIRGFLNNRKVRRTPGFFGSTDISSDNDCQSFLMTKTTNDTTNSLTLSLLPATLTLAKKSTTLEQGKSGENPALSRNGNS